MKKEPVSPDEVKIFGLKHCIRHAIESLKTETGCTTEEVIKFLLVVRPFEIIFPNVINAEGQDKENKIDNITKYIKLYSNSIKECLNWFNRLLSAFITGIEFFVIGSVLNLARFLKWI